MVLQMVARANPANARRTDYFFRVHVYAHRDPKQPTWLVLDEAVPVPRAWFRARKKGED